MDNPRAQLAAFIAQVGIIDAWAILQTYPISLEQMVIGLAPIPADVSAKVEAYTGPHRFNYRRLAERAVRALAQSYKREQKLREENARLKAQIAAQRPQEGV